MKIKSLGIRNFKGIRERAVNFGDVTIISGQNTSGKTTVFVAAFRQRQSRLLAV